MKARYALIFPIALAGAAFIIYTIGQAPAAASPTHVAAVFIDGLNHGDYRQACAQIQSSVVAHNWKNQSGCETYFTVDFAQYASLFGTISGYKVIDRSRKEWREGDARVASVRVSYNGGAGVVIRLVETAAGWKVASSRSAQ
jgi:hypothetical protein